MPVRKSSRSNIPTSRKNDLYSIDPSLLHFSQAYEPNKSLSCGHAVSGSRSVSEPSPRTDSKVVEKK